MCKNSFKKKQCNSVHSYAMSVIKTCYTLLKLVLSESHHSKIRDFPDFYDQEVGAGLAIFREV
jgi:hypothetical protein